MWSVHQNRVHSLTHQQQMIQLMNDFPTDSADSAFAKLPTEVQQEIEQAAINVVCSRSIKKKVFVPNPKRKN